MKPEDPKLIAAIYFIGEDLDPEYITRILGINPTRAQRRGERRITASGREYVEKLGLWSLSVEICSPSLDDHLSDLLASFSCDVSLSSIAGVDDAYVDVFVGLVSDADGDAKGELQISPQVLESLARLGLPIRLTISVGRD